MNKKAELTSKQLITIIILIVSFSVIIAFFVMINLKGEISRESCRNSVMMKGIFSKIIPFFGKNMISLKCETEKICFSMGGDCNEKTDRTIEVKDKHDLWIEIDNLKKECSWMFGEEKIDYAGNEDCAICYRIYFDNEIKSKIKSISPNEKIETSKDYAILTEKKNDAYFYPKAIEFSADKLKEQCRNFITEI